MSKAFGVKRALVALAMVGGAVFAAPGAASAGVTYDPDICRGSGGSGYQSCNGKDPNTMGCSAVTVDEGQAKNGVYIELRYSSGCQAYWTRYTNTYGSSGEARIKSTIGTLMYKKTLAAYAGETGWTPMMAANQSPTGCEFFWYSAYSQYLEYCVR